ncbi:MAG: response regulator [Acidobacteria bacterium]|nr:response regulator [Acidobacteriota bacterium]MBV9070142.1 response regulator [Acidobacteriota bacterium]MBV9186317.1 response regulator [Acidobacteriota bacterium]
MTTKRQCSIREKLTGIIMITSTTAVLLACAGFTVTGLLNFRKRLIADISTISRVIASNSAAALAFNDQPSAHEVLGALQAKPSVIAAGIYNQRGEPFAKYEPNHGITIPARALPDGVYDVDDHLELFSAIRLGDKRIGTLYVSADNRDRAARVQQYKEIAAVIVVFSLLAAFLLAARLQRLISAPIVELARVAALVSKEKSFIVRAAPTKLNDELGNLVNAFNRMLDELEQRDHKLVEHQTQLETTVAQRTAELTVANQELLMAKNAAEKAAAQSAQLARESALILNNATDGILGLGLDNRPAFVNPSAVRMLGMRMEDFDGKTIHEAIHHSHADGTPFPEEECVNTIAMRSGIPIGMVDDTFWRADGTSFPVEYSSTPMRDETGRHIGAVVVFRDVTERRAIEKLKSEFVSTVSHELRTPLTSIRGALGLLSSGLLGPVAETGQRMLKIAVDNTDRLVRLINDILDLERVASGEVELKRGPLDAQTVVNQACEGLQPMADQEGIRIVVEPFAGTLWGDSDRVIQTLTNLIGNAIKFSPPNTVVTLSGTAGATEFTFCVADQGRGVPEDKLSTIFQRFSQVDASDSRTKGGSGLGLAICQSIVTAHGGRIWAEKNEPAGTRVQFTIPLAVRAAVSQTAADAARPAIPNGDAPSVLIVEDDFDLGRVMTEALQRHGLQTFHTASGSEAVQLCAANPPSLIVLDLGLPDLDGYGVVSALRKNKQLKNVPLLVYSALDLGSAEQCRLRLGPTEFLTKSRCSLTDFEEHVIGLLKAVTGAKDSHAA